MGTFGFGGIIPNGNIRLTGLAGGGTVTVLTVPALTIARVCVRLYNPTIGTKLIVGGTTLIPSPGYANTMPPGTGLTMDNIVLGPGETLQFQNGSSLSSYLVLGMYFRRTST